MEGRPNSVPWDLKLAKMTLLFKMCRDTEKPLLAAGLGI
jgi:hypothetical protein